VLTYGDLTARGIAGGRAGVKVDTALERSRTEASNTTPARNFIFARARLGVVVRTSEQRYSPL